MAINMNGLDWNVTDFLLLQEISEMKLNRILGNENNTELHFYDDYKNSLFISDDLKRKFYATVGSTTDINNTVNSDYIGGAGKYTKISKTQADYFLDNFTIKDYYGNDNTGFSATVFAKNGDTNEITISFRSTEFGEDYYKDAYGADTEISNNGTAIAQNIAMLNYINKLRTDGIITTGTKINLTGYSLGGHLASSAYKYIETLPNVSIGKLYVFDGVGVGNVSNNQYGLLDNDLLQYNPILNIFNYFFENNITNSTVALNYVNGLNISQTVKDFFNFLSTKIHSVNPYDTSYELNYLLNNQSWFAKSFLGENEVEVAKSINEGNNKNSNYLNNTIYSSDLYINFSKFLINKFTLTKASSPDSSGSNIGDVIGDLVRGAQSDKTGDDTKDYLILIKLFGLMDKQVSITMTLCLMILI